MTAPPACTLIAPSKLRAVALFVCLACVLAVALRGLVPDPSAVFLAGELDPTGVAAAVLGGEVIVLLAGVGLWLAIAVSPRLAGRAVSRARSSFRAPVSPAVVATLIVVAAVLTVSLAPLLPPDALYANLLVFLSLGVVVFVLTRRLGRTGVRLGSLLGLGSWSAFRTGVVTAVCAFVLLKPVMFAIQVALLLVAGRFKVAFDFQGLVREFVQYPAGPKFALLLLTTVLIPPVLEEIVFRAFLFGSLRVFAGSLGAAALSAGVFAILHAAPWQSLHLFILGVCLALVYEKTQSLYASIFLHMLVNAETVGLIVLARFS